jgi:dUTP pyrophosphatase
MNVPVRLSNGGALPQYATTGAAGADLRSAEDFSLAPMERRAVSTGVHLQIPAGYEGQVRPRSGLAMRHGISMVNSPGTIDSDYRGEVKVLLINLGEHVVEFSAGDRIAQLVICPVQQVVFESVETLDETDRGSGGFGSTGQG